MNGHDTAVYRFGGFLLVPKERVLLHEGERVALAGKAYDLLVSAQSRHSEVRSSTFAARLTSIPHSRSRTPRSPIPTRHWVI
jgi:hypothetical protein